jgi:hypothetical protein
VLEELLLELDEGLVVVVLEEELDEGLVVLLELGVLW